MYMEDAIAIGLILWVPAMAAFAVLEKWRKR